MSRRSDRLKETASQTAGPYVHIGLCPSSAGFEIYGHEFGHDFPGRHASGERIRVAGRVLDGTNAPVCDAVLEVWQANADGNYAHPDGGAPVEDGFCGWGRVIPDLETGEWSFETIKPGPVPGRAGTMQAPHISFWIIARGINIGLSTRLYFADEHAANTGDPILNLIGQEDRRSTLIADRTLQGDRPVYRFDIRLQGTDETVFFDI